MMKSANLIFGDPRCPFTQIIVDTSDDLEEIFGPDEKIFPLVVDMAEADVDAMLGSVNAWDRCYDSDDSCGECPYNRFRRARNHECMWGGQCCNKEFQRARPRNPPAPVAQRKAQPLSVAAAKCSAGVRPDGARTKAAPLRADGNRSLLLNRAHPPPQPPPRPPTPQSSRPETPVSLASEDDLGPIPIDALNTAGVFRSALDHLTTSPALGHRDNGFIFGDSNRTKQEKSVALRSSATDVLRSSAGTISDHNYGVTSKNFKLQGLGVDTPSDSEEEIDVVSVSSGERSRSGSMSGGSGLPTRPTATDQRQLESLLSASQAVSRKLKRAAPLTCPVTPKRGRGDASDRSQSSSEEGSSEDGESDDDDDDDDEMEDDDFSEGSRSAISTYLGPGRPRGSPGRRKKATGWDEDRRDLHNNMERQRRIDLRNSFEILRELVPSVACLERAAKVAILREAAAHCRELGAECRGRSVQVQALRKEQERLRATVSSLRRQAAVCRR